MGIEKSVLGTDNLTKDQPKYSIQHKVDAGLVTHVYKQGTIGLASSLLCGTVILLGLYSIPERTLLISWFIVFLIVAFARYITIEIFLKKNPFEINLARWSHIFSIGALANGLCWGFIGGFLLPHENLGQMSLTLFILAGMTAGAVPLLCGIKLAVFSFLAASLIPLIGNFVYHGGWFNLFALALIVYFIYLNALAIKTYHMIKTSITLQYENDTLVEDLSRAKQELEESNVKLEHAAKHDPLTDLANRTLFEINFENAIARAQQESRVIALLYLDIDNFKEVNDAYGHHVGDLLLQQVVARIKRKLPENVMASRLGGDELTVILEEVIEPEEITDLCQKICSEIAKPFEINDYNLSVTTSIGISLYPIDGADTEMLIKNADKAMYKSKAQGGNTFHFHTEFATLKSAVSTAFTKKPVSHLRNS